MAIECDCGRFGSSERVRLLLVDDHDFVRMALAEVLASEADMSVVGLCADGSEVVPTAAESRPDVVIMDLSMPRVDGLAATEALLQSDPRARVVLLTSSGADARERAAAVGVRAYVVKRGDLTELLDCIRAVVTDCRCCPCCLQ
jgi:DNA-binding NarL/FixJ family response regulator